MTDFHFATAWELIADAIPRAPALICDEVERTWQEYDDRSARLARVLSDHGLGPGSHVAIDLFNCNEHLEAQFAAFKLRGTPINVNYRYTTEEVLYLLEDSDAEAVIFDQTFATVARRCREELPKVKVWIEVTDGDVVLPGALHYESAIEAAAPLERMERSADDIYLFYTGGTTGMPKGVMLHTGEFVEYTMPVFRYAGVEPPQKVDEIGERVVQLHELGRAPVSLPACPLMHGTGMWMNAMPSLLQGGSVVTIPRPGLDSEVLWRTAERRRVTHLAIVGDAFAEPMLEALENARDQGHPYQLKALRQILSSGAMWSAENKSALLEHLDVVLYDSMGSTESDVGSSITSRKSKGPTATARFETYPGVKVVAPDGRAVEPGSGEIGELLSPGWVPLGYYKDPEKTARLIRVIDGKRYSVTGDFAQIESDGSIKLLGRGNACINTGGEKVFPEEVETVLKRHAGVRDCVVVGVPHVRFGQSVAAVVSRQGPANGAPASDDEVLGFVREHLAGFKVPRLLVFVDEVPRRENGKANYERARQIARDASEQPPS